MIYICVPTTKDRRERLKELLASIDEHTQDVPHAVVVYENRDGGWVPAVHNMIKGIDGFVVLLGSDVVVQKDWLKNLWDGFVARFPDKDGLAQPFDEINNGKLCQHPLGHSSTIKKYLYKGFVHNFSDNDLTDQLLAEDKYVYVPTAKIEHKHFVNHKAPVDETYKMVFNKEQWEKDEALYKKRNEERSGGVFINNFNDNGKE